MQGDIRCANLFSLIEVLLISLPIDEAILLNSLFWPGLFCRSRCLASMPRFPSAVRLRIESTQDLNSWVRSWTDIRGIRIWVTSVEIVLLWQAVLRAEPHCNVAHVT